MIQANELRIGNWYLGASRGNPLQATARFIQQLDEGLLNCSPIPLTPEILEKCGLWGKYKSVGYIYRNDILNLSSEDEGDDGLPIKDYVFHVYHDYKGQPIYYLHQLQNLYFCLTGEELIFNPNN